MLRHWVGGAAAVTAAVMVASAFAAPNERGGVIYFRGKIVEDGYTIGMTPRAMPGVVGAKGTQMQAADTSANRQIAVDFSTQARMPVPVEVSVTARTASSDVPLRVGEARSGASVRVAYEGFRSEQSTKVLASGRGGLTVSRAAGAEPIFTTITVAYR